ncbi:MAG: hypothetical protein IJI22_03990 [Bacilli bacterium]|nr:hypothetical protein [Bacilli bacterium]
MKNNKKIYLFYFCFFIFIFALSPISGDDWGNYLVGAKGLKHMLGNALGMYFSWEGRLTSRILINILTYNKWLWNIINTLVIISTIYLINNICNFKNKKLLILFTFIMITFMNIYTFSQTIVWIAGNITYLFVIPLILLYINLLPKNKKINKQKMLILIILNTIIPMFVEHMALLLIFINLVFLIIYYLKNKKINKKLFIFLIISITSFLSMFFSPGNQYRTSVENIDFNKLSIIKKLLYNLPNFTYYTYTINTLLLLVIFIGSILLIKNSIKNKYLKIFLYLYETPSVFLGIIYLLVELKVSNISIYQNNIVIIYYLILTIINFYLILKNKKDFTKNRALFFYIIGIFSNTVMLLSPTWGYRTSLATYLFLTTSYLIIIDNYIKENKLLTYGLYSCNILGVLFYSIFYINIHKAYLDNLKAINTGKKNNKKIIEITAYPNFAPCNINPNNDYHLNKFYEYYNINKNTEIKLIDNHWKLIYYKK